jgi:hypothetical protein
VVVNDDTRGELSSSRAVFNGRHPPTVCKAGKVPREPHLVVIGRQDHPAGFYVGAYQRSARNRSGCGDIRDRVHEQVPLPYLGLVALC